MFATRPSPSYCQPWYAHTSLQPYADAMKKVGKDQDVPVIDLHAASLALFDRLGDSGSADLSAAADDRSHFSRTGALAMARLVADALPAAVPTRRTGESRPRASAAPRRPRRMRNGTRR